MHGRLGIDLRHVPVHGAGAGVSHASVELAEALIQLAVSRRQIELLNKKGGFLTVRKFIRDKKIDCLLVPSGAVPPFMNIPCFPWVHDVEIFEHPEWFDQSFLKRAITTRLFLRGIHRAPHIFTVSEDTKEKLVRMSGVAEQRITVTYQGIKPIAPGSKKRYALILGSVNPRKNIPFIQQIWPEVQKRISDAELIIAGQPYMTFDDQERDELIRHATVLLLPSFHEGFGRTALEAMSAGVPVIASNRGAIPEVVGDAGRLYDPTDRHAWIEGIVSAFNDSLDGSRGMERSRLFSWDKTARIMLAKLEEYC
ncbi:glycosyltransferase family 4 protein [Candidatus Uhrbacteria bacterium]|nr:glycosyltransferase family 4 protein [Candidatus Uhrbacteria bacterium]